MPSSPRPSPPPQVDYPNVTHVIQYGSAEHRETYIHRLGRTGRAGKKGQGLVIVGSPEEEQRLGEVLWGLDVKRDDVSVLVIVVRCPCPHLRLQDRRRSAVPTAPCDHRALSGICVHAHVAL